MHLWVCKGFHLLGQAPLKYFFFMNMRAGIWLLYPGHAQYIIVLFMEHIGKKWIRHCLIYHQQTVKLIRAMLKIANTPPPTSAGRAAQISCKGWVDHLQKTVCFLFVFKMARGSISVCKKTFRKIPNIRDRPIQKMVLWSPVVDYNKQS